MFSNRIFIIYKTNVLIAIQAYIKGDIKTNSAFKLKPLHSNGISVAKHHWHGIVQRTQTKLVTINSLNTPVYCAQACRVFPTPKRERSL